MSSMKASIRPLFYWLRCALRCILGLAFVVAPHSVLQAVNVPSPYHVGFVQFPAALLIVFAAMSLLRDGLAITATSSPTGSC